jgi:hypothetical protein
MLWVRIFEEQARVPSSNTCIQQTTALADGAGKCMTTFYNIVAWSTKLVQLFLCPLAFFLHLFEYKWQLSLHPL